MSSGRVPEVVILGGGFGGLYAAKALRKAPVSITLIDRKNHHTFQPLLYQVATAALSPGEIAVPIRNVLRNQQNVRVILAEATSIDLPSNLVILDDGALAFDHLIIATGATQPPGGPHAEPEALRRAGDAARGATLVCTL